MKLILFSGLPGTGKSTLAEALGRRLSVPVFAKDWLEAVLVRCALEPSDSGKPLGFAGYELLTVLAERQLMLGQSAILDSVTGTESLRTSWKQLAERYQAGWRVIECICSDESLHRTQLAIRQRSIPGWHELEWTDVEKVRAYFRPWTGERLLVDMADPYEENLAKVMTYCQAL